MPWPSSLRAARAVPHVPLVERQPQTLAGALQALHVVADRRHLVNVAIHVEVHRQVARGAVARPLRGVAVIRVQRDAVHLVVAFLEHFAVPGEIGRHERAAGPARDQLQIRIDDAHLLGRVARLAAVLARLQLADLPRPVHFVAEAPVAHVVRPLVAVRPPQIAPARAALEVAVLDVVHGHLDRTRAEVHAEQRLGADGAAPFDELVGAELIGLERIPRALEHGRPLRFRTDAVEPVVAGDEVASRVADDRHAEFLDLAHDVGAESFGVGERRPGLVHARVDGAAQVLQERSQHAPVEFARPGALRRNARAGPRFCA